VGAVGAGWIYVRNSGGVWTQQGGKLIGGGAVGLVARVTRTEGTVSSA
jgi:hypothetical protein